METAAIKIRDTIISLLECPVCTEFMAAPIIQCKNGHNTCSECKNKLNRCPTCKDNFSSVRNVALEQLVCLLKIPCSNAEFGCNEEMKMIDLKTHKQKCPHRLYKCTVNNCAWKGRRNELLQHFKSEHNKYVRDNSQLGARMKFHFTIKYDSWYDECLLCAVHNEIFWLKIYYIRGNILYIIVQYIGPDIFKNLYKYKVKFYSESSSISFTTDTHADFEDVATLRSSLKCPHIQDIVSKKFINDNCLGCSVEIIRK